MIDVLSHTCAQVYRVVSVCCDCGTLGMSFVKSIPDMIRRSGESEKASMSHHTVVHERSNSEEMIEATDLPIQAKED